MGALVRFVLHLLLEIAPLREAERHLLFLEILLNFALVKASSQRRLEHSPIFLCISTSRSVVKYRSVGAVVRDVCLT